MLNPDLPITKSDEDRLNRSDFAKSLANAILKRTSSSSFTIGLYGKWGSGKSSLLNMVLENIENDDKSVVVLRFNPWLCTDSKQLISQFIKQLATAIELKIPNGDRVWEIIARYADLFDAAGAIPYKQMHRLVRDQKVYRRDQL